MRRLRRTLLYVPGNNPAMITNGGLFGADVLVFDLEDAVAPREKDAARCLVVEALGQPMLVNPHGAEVMVRINGLDTPFWEDDLRAIVAAGPDSIRLPKVEGAETVLAAAEALERFEKELGHEGAPIEISPILETAAGVARAGEIARAHPRVTALSFGAEDYTRDLGTSRSKEGTELLHARGCMLLAAKAAGVQALDTVFGDVNDLAGLERETRAGRQLGFDGKSVIHPRQVEVVHAIYRPSDEEVRRALAIEAALAEAESRGLGVASLDGRMIDAPVAKKAAGVLALARRLGLVEGGDAGVA